MVSLKLGIELNKILHFILPSFMKKKTFLLVNAFSFELVGVYFKIIVKRGLSLPKKYEC